MKNKILLYCVIYVQQRNLNVVVFVVVACYWKLE